MFYRFYRGGHSSWVICVIAGGKGTIEVGCQSGGGRVQGMRNTLVCPRLLTYAHLKAVWYPHALTFSVSCTSLQSTHRLDKKTTLACALKMLTWTWLLFAPPLLFTLSYLKSSHFWSVTYGIYLYLLFPGKRLILEEIQCTSLDQT